MFALGMKQHLLGFLTLALLIGYLFTGIGCATIVPPEGGPRDTIPPRLLKATPRDSTTNFTGKAIELHFNEYVDLQDVQRNILFTPTFQVNPVIEAKLRTITIKIRDTLEPNTTYTFNFGDAIKDINEGNVLRNFSYVFSTGPRLDSLTLSGKVTVAETGKLDTTLTVLLYKKLTDSAVINDRPRYLTKLNGRGEFTFKNLPSGTFAVYALGDASGSHRYQTKNQMFGFLDSAVVVKPGSAPVNILAYQETTAPTTAPAGGNTSPRGNTPADKRLKYTHNAGSGLDLLGQLQLKFERSLKFVDSNQVHLTMDSTFKPVRFSTSLDSTRKTLTIKSNWEQGGFYRLLLGKGFAEDSVGRKLLRADTLKFNVLKTSDYGTLTIKVRNVDSKEHPILQFVQNNLVMFSAPISTGTFHADLFNPGDYELRVLYDANNNGKWDPGKFFGKKRQPEIVKPIEKHIMVKPNWDNELEVSL